MRGLHALGWWCHAGSDLGRWASTLHVDGVRKLRGILGTYEPVERHVVEVRITKVLTAIGVSEAHDFRQHVNLVGTAPTHFSDGMGKCSRMFNICTMCTPPELGGGIVTMS